MSKYYTDKEKEVLINYFVTEGTNSKKDFKEYVENYVKEHGSKVDNKFKDRRIEGAWSEMGNYEIEKNNYFWGNDNNDNVVTYMYADSNFIPSGAKIKNLNKLGVDWCHVNNQGENILFYTRMYHLKETENLIQTHNIPTELINNQGEVFFTHIFDNYKSSSLDMENTRIERVRLEDTMNLVSKYSHLFQKMTKEKIQYVQEKFNECVDIIEQRLYQIATKENKDKKFSYEEDKDQDKLPYKEHRLYMEKIFSYYLLDKKLVIDNTKLNPRKMKI